MRGRQAARGVSATCGRAVPERGTDGTANGDRSDGSTLLHPQFPQNLNWFGTIVRHRGVRHFQWPPLSPLGDCFGVGVGEAFGDGRGDAAGLPLPVSLPLSLPLPLSFALPLPWSFALPLPLDLWPSSPRCKISSRTEE